MRIRWPWTRRSELPPVFIAKVQGHPKIFLDPRRLSEDQIAETAIKFMEDQTAVDDGDARKVSALLDRTPGAFERAQEGLMQAKAKRTTDLDDL